jgi:glutaminase
MKIWLFTCSCINHILKEDAHMTKNLEESMYDYVRLCTTMYKCMSLSVTIAGNILD